MSRLKLTGLVVMLVGITYSVWYLESIKTQPIRSENLPAIPIAAIGESSTSSRSETLSLDSIAAEDRKAGFKPATELSDPTGFINAKQFKLADLIGKKVILIDFWTYSCINCIRTLPHLTSWYDKYHDQGLEIVGVHTPEFDFEKDYGNVEAATKKYGIKYPVVLDSNHGTWNAYGNLYWPREYLIDIAGYIVHDHIGEGGYEETEQEIQKLLAERTALSRNKFVSSSTSTTPLTQNLSGIKSPETYFGAARNDYLANGSSHVVGIQNLAEPASVAMNNLYLVGSWAFQDEFASNKAPGAKIIFKYHSAKVFFVASASSGATVEVLRDGVPLSDAAGSDVKNGKAYIKESRLYNLVNDPNGAGDHTLEIIINDHDLQVYTFTFG